MKSLLENIDTAQDDLQIKFSLTKGELQKEINLRKDIVKLQKENILKHLINKTVDGVHQEEMLHEKKKDRLLRVASVKINLKKPQQRSLVNQAQADPKLSQDKAVETEALLKNVESQQKSIQSIMDALKGLADFKQNVQQEIGSIANDISKMKGEWVCFVVLNWC